MPTTTFLVTGLDGRSYSSGSSRTATFTLSTGNKIPSDAVITSATMHFSDLGVYTKKAPSISFGIYGGTETLSVASQNGPQTVGYNFGESLRQMTSGSVSAIFSYSTSDSNLINVRDNCIITLYVDYTTEPEPEPEPEVKRTMMFYDGSRWQSCYVYYYNGSSWQLCDYYYYTGSKWT